MLRPENLMPHQCPCGSNKKFNDCCGQYINDLAIAPTAETLMRSRYSAYSLAKIDYIVNTMRAPATNGFDPVDTKRWAEQSKWLGLKVVNTKEGQATDNRGWVEFIARYELNAKTQSMHERSEFHKIDGRWYYVSGEMIR